MQVTSIMRLANFIKLAKLTDGAKRVVFNADGFLAKFKVTTATKLQGLSQSYLRKLCGISHHAYAAAKVQLQNT